MTFRKGRGRGGPSGPTGPSSAIRKHIGPKQMLKQAVQMKDTNQQQTNRGAGGGGRGGARFRNRAFHKGGRGAHQGLETDFSGVTLQVSNVEEGIKEHQLRTFLTNKASRPINIQKIELYGSIAYVTVPGVTQANFLKGISGVQFRGHELDISYPRTALTTEQRAAFKHLIQQLYHSDSKFLDLSGFQAKLFASGLNMPAHFTRATFCTDLFDAVKDVCPDVVTLNLEGNKLSSVAELGQALNKFMEEGGKIQNLSLKSNQLEYYKELDSLKPLGLREIVLDDNPMASNPKYRSEVTGRLGSSLKFLDQVEVKPAVMFKVPITTRQIEVPLAGSYLDNPQNETVVVQFIRGFFELYDGADRRKLSVAYSSKSFFSLALHDTVTQRLTGSYTGLDRNLVFVQDTGRQRRNLVVGDDIAPQLQRLPRTKHDVDSFVVDAFVLGANPSPIQMLVVNVHGHFTDLSAKGGSDKKFSFDRTFILVPSTTTSPEEQSWPVTVMRDSLLIRPYSMLPTPTVQSLGPPASAAASSSAPSAAPDQAMQEQMAMQMATAMGISPQDALQALMAANFDPNAAAQLVARAMASSSPS
eukprot:TRINITY_DN4458_c0_g1::TRINITY_DN4458_c0_g1_i1::g.7308::m.7308 TRINITY_DN4458_c0_g1::TRINITY_DN4458_c0_g1_i1::g.7308  ORF type:complete len:585 (-),score=104.53,sp/Q99JX7/NXF1_MOUSE/25.87/2e-35,LRR_4/PF12799.2/0.77,LRR_4/PF12799.2/1.8,DbpA/PF03880.10/0.072,UBA/PF00627.26/0.19 TRINITY_DN4458_c0_g1_i1:765-2519(-)